MRSPLLGTNFTFRIVRYSSKNPALAGFFVALLQGFRPLASIGGHGHPKNLMAFLMAFCWDAISERQGRAPRLPSCVLLG
ncbi:hypothetical protein J2Y48_000476 [Mycoplana sp. BE70]|nr:hypothetical protein [Mycoplana sp. BE70]